MQSHPLFNRHTSYKKVLGKGANSYNLFGWDRLRGESVYPLSFIHQRYGASSLSFLLLRQIDHELGDEHQLRHPGLWEFAFQRRIQTDLTLQHLIDFRNLGLLWLNVIFELLYVLLHLLLHAPFPLPVALCINPLTFSLATIYWKTLEIGQSKCYRSFFTYSLNSLLDLELTSATLRSLLNSEPSAFYDSFF